MNENLNHYARELIDAINAAVAQDSDVQACRDRAKVAGFDLNVSLEAVVSLVDRGHPPGRAGEPDVQPIPSPAPRPHAITAADRRFLRSLRIGAGEVAEEEA